MISPELERAGAEAVQELEHGLCKAVEDVFKRHGNDPNASAIVAAGFAMAINHIGESIDPGVPRMVRTMLEKWKP